MTFMTLTNENPLISIIVPIYKVEAYLKRCVDSIINQSYPNLEIILVNDGSPDNCPAICDEYKNKDARIKVIHKTNGGLSDARNAGIDIATGKYFAFIDSDDYVSSIYVESLFETIKATDAEIAIVKFLAFSNEKAIHTENSLVLPKTVLIKEAISRYTSLDTSTSMTFISCWNKLYKRELFNELRFPKGKLYEDAFTSYKLLATASKIGFLEKPLYFYYVRHDSIMGQQFTIKNLQVLEAYQGAIDWVQKKVGADLAKLFYPPLLMREIYCYWGAKVILKDKDLAKKILNSYRKNTKQLLSISTLSMFWKVVLLTFAKCPWLYLLYRRASPFYYGDR